MARTELARTDVKPDVKPDAGRQLGIFRSFPVATDRLKVLLGGEALKRTIAVARNPRLDEETRLQAMLTLRNAKLIVSDFDLVQKTLQKLSKVDPSTIIRSVALEVMEHQRNYVNEIFKNFSCMGPR